MKVRNLEELYRARVFWEDVAVGTEVVEPREQMELGRSVLVLLRMLERLSMPEERGDCMGPCMSDEEVQNQTLTWEWEGAEQIVDEMLEYPNEQ